MDMPTKLITNAETGESEMIELTADELAQRDKDAAEYAAKDAANAQANLDKVAVLNKLGLTADEAKLLLG